jgi:hypothetical protein
MTILVVMYLPSNQPGPVVRQVALDITACANQVVKHIHGSVHQINVKSAELMAGKTVIVR